MCFSSSYLHIITWKGIIFHSRDATQQTDWDTVVSDHGISLSRSTSQNFSPSPKLSCFLQASIASCMQARAAVLPLAFNLSCSTCFLLFPKAFHILEGWDPISHYETNLIQVLVLRTGHATEGNLKKLPQVFFNILVIPYQHLPPSRSHQNFFQSSSRT